MKKFQMFIKRMMLFSFSCLLLALSFLTIRAAGEVDPTFNAAVQESRQTGGQNTSAQTIVVQPDGKFLVGGNFTVAGNTARTGIARFNADGSIDQSFNPPELFYLSGTRYIINNIFVYAIALQADGKILIGGTFDRIGSQTNRGIFRLNTDGSIDPTFILATSEVLPYEIKIQTDNRIVIGGFGGLVRFNSNGSRDNSFQSSQSNVRSFVVQPDGKIILVDSDTGVRRVNADGAIDNTFFPVSANSISKLVLLSDGKILAGGSFANANGSPQGGIIRLNADGNLDSSFNPGGVGTSGGINAIVVLPDGKIFIGGFFTNYNGVARLRNARLNSDGTLDTNFNYTPNSTSLIYAAAADGGGRLIIGGSDSSGNWDKLARLNANGSPDTTFLGAIYNRGTVYRVLAQPDGKVLVVGSYTRVNGVPRQAIVRLNTDGTLDTGFASIVSGTGLAVALQADGKILVSGSLSFSNPSGDQVFIGRLNSDGSLDPSFQSPISFTGTTVRITEIAALPSGKILIGGYFPLSGSTAAVARLNSDGSDDNTFTKSVITSGANDPGILALKVQPDGKIVIGGTFNRIGTSNRGKVARLNADGTLDATFNQPFGAGNDIYDLTLQSTGSVIIGGIFASVNANTNFSYLARLFPDATLDTSFNPQQGETVHTLETQANDKILVGGLFTTVSGVTRNNLVRLNANGTLDSSFNGSGTNDIVLNINAQSNGKILVGGQFTRVNGVPSVGVARLLSATGQTPFDFNGDGRADVSVFRPSSGTWYTSTNPAINYGAIQFGIASDKLVPADYDGDGRTDVAVFRDGRWYLLRSQAGFTDISFGLSSDVPVPADYDGDGRADIAVFRPSNATWYLLRSNLGYTSVELGLSTDKPVPADYDGDGRAEPAVFRPSNGFWYNSTDPAINYGGVQFGAANDKPVPADYDGDGKIDRAVFRPSNGTWYLLQSAAGFTGISFGIGSDLPSAADYDGDGKADVAVFRSGIWYLNRTTAGFTSIQFGLSDDKPVPNSFVR